MNVIIGSAFRNSVHYLSRYFTQAAMLQQALAPFNNRVRVVAAEGDSTDGTRGTLASVSSAFGVECDIVDASHGGRWFGSTEEPERMRVLSHVGNAILNGAAGRMTVDDVLVYVESDLVWDVGIIVHLITDLTVNNFAPHFHSLSPLVMAGDAFYDIWGFRGLNGERYSPFHPYHHEWADALGNGRPYAEVSSVGSCLVMTGRLVRDYRVRMEDGALVQFCERARSLGYRFGASTHLEINHP